MCKKLLSLLLCALPGFVSAVAPEDAVPLADPFILCENGVYYAYGTCSADGIAVLVSDDLKHWY